MKYKVRSLFAAAIVLFALAVVREVSAQHSYDHRPEQWKKGMVRLNNSAWVGNVRLSRGMYHVRHVVEGDKHWLVFKAVTLRAGYQEGFMWEGQEVVRIECRIAAAEKSLRNTRTKVEKIGRERVIAEIQIAGENVRHLLMNDSSV